MRQRSGTSGPGSALRLFAIFAAVSLVPVLLLGLVLAASYRSDAAARGLSQARAQAGLFSRTSIEPRLAGADLDRPLRPVKVGGLDQMSRSSVRDGDIVRFRVRSLDGRVIYSSDGSTSSGTDDEALEAASGRTVAELTYLDADTATTGAVGDGAGHERVAEVYTPLTDGRSASPVGVLELYLPYAPIARDVGAGVRSLSRDLAVGLALLYVVLAGISWSVTGKLRAQSERNAHLATFDQLTGLPNRRSFQVRLGEILAQAPPPHPVYPGHPAHHETVTAIAVLGLDRFKEVNDTLGHGNGDTLLVEVGRRLGEVLDDGDFVARLGGDEFAVIFASTSRPVVLEQVLAVQQSLCRGMDLAGIPVEVEATVGLAWAPGDGLDAETLLRHADVAVHLAKQGRMRVAHYDQELDPYDPTRLTLVADLRRAIASDELFLEYQPKIDLRTRRVETVEALIRWNHPDRGLIMPDEFLPVIEQTEMIDPMTAWVLDTALAWVTHVEGPSGRLRVAVNVSARSLVHASFPGQVLEALDRLQCPPGRLAIEVTETALIDDPERARASLRRLAAAGVRISVDDFGRGQTSLSQLASMPLHEVKIDKSFVTDMDEVRAHAAIVSSVIDLAHSLDLEVVAEGVENQQVMDVLDQAGCDVAQGYHIARPMSAAALRPWLVSYGENRASPTRV